ncbi:MerR family transcriptional regulator [Ornithinimicrobium sp. W1665]|uniref:MerR family transcriptional regulator n=1 Tax=Ornithinimicrobium sp. W1665 TaxID=3416666 RepID=UPI003CF9C96E
MTAEHEGLVHIGEVVERTGLSHRTVRYYEEMGLVAPAGRTEGGFRLYDRAGIDRLLLITPMKPLGFSIEEIGELLAALDTATDPEADLASRKQARELLDDAHAGVQERIRELGAALSRAEAFAERLRQESPTAVGTP